MTYMSYYMIQYKEVLRFIPYNQTFNSNSKSTASLEQNANVKKNKKAKERRNKETESKINKNILARINKIEKKSRKNKALNQKI